MTDDDSRLLAALAVIQARGAIGERALDAAVGHADRFVALVPPGPRTLVDLGSGGGLPALVIGWRRPDVVVTLVERRTTRADLLRRAVASLDLGTHVTVVDQDVERVAATSGRAFAVVTSRSFADLATTVGYIDRLLAADGVALVSEPPTDRSGAWSAVLEQHRDLVNGGVVNGIRVLRRSSSGAPSVPRETFRASRGCEDGST